MCVCMCLLCQGSDTVEPIQLDTADTDTKIWDFADTVSDTDTKFENRCICIKLVSRVSKEFHCIFLPFSKKSLLKTFVKKFKF